MTLTTEIEGTHSDQHRFAAFVADPSFPCLGAKSALNRDRMRMAQCGAMGSADATAELLRQIKAFAAEFPIPGTAPVSFVALFDNTGLSEAAFEKALWAQLQALHERDVAQGNAWDDSVSRDPASSEFSFSVAGRAFFVVGLHPQASRTARRAPVPCLVFNFHAQFEALKASGKYQKMQSVIRERDIALQGFVNPVLAKFGESSEARQYAGRNVDAGWRCPFHAKEAGNA